MRFASQPTVSRFEHTATPRTLLRLGHALTDTVIARHRRRHRRATRITIDIDVTADPTHGAQQLTFFNGFYGSWCYLPLVAFLTFDDEPRQYLVEAMLRPGNAPTTIGIRGLLKRLLPKLWVAFPRAQLRVRLDGGFASPDTFDLLETAGVEYVVAMAKNRVLAALAEPLLQLVRAPAVATNTTTTTYGEAGYQAKTWRRPRRVIIKAEVVCLDGREPRDNPRFVITNLRQTPRWIYTHVYAARGDSENRLKEHQARARPGEHAAPHAAQDRRARRAVRTPAGPASASRAPGGRRVAHARVSPRRPPRVTRRGLAPHGGQRVTTRPIARRHAPHTPCHLARAHALPVTHCLSAAIHAAAPHLGRPS